MTPKEVDKNGDGEIDFQDRFLQVVEGRCGANGLQLPGVHAHDEKGQ